jgi:hypothetical protein
MTTATCVSYTHERNDGGDRIGLHQEPLRCRCRHGDDWHGPDGCEALGCPCEKRADR